MALSVDFWRNEQQLNIFRTKRCQRLLRNGICEWRDQCQYSHSLDWPRRPPQRHRYDPEVCPHLQRVVGSNGEARIQNLCNAGLRCPYAHSKEEVLYHPHFFKTCMCEEHQGGRASAASGQGNRGSRGTGRSRCHRYYCPFAHGAQELRSTPLSPQQREQCLQSLKLFPSDECCQICDPHQMPPPEQAQAEAHNGNAPVGFMAPVGSPQSWTPHMNRPMEHQADGERGVGCSKDRYPMPPYAVQAGDAVQGHQPQLMAINPWGAMQEMQGITADGVGTVQPQDMHRAAAQQVMAVASPGPGRNSPQPQVMQLAAIAPASPMGPGGMQMLQLAPVPAGATGGCAMAGTAMAGSAGQLQVVQVTPVSTPPPLGRTSSFSSPTAPEQPLASPRQEVRALLSNAGLDSCFDTFLQHNFSSVGAVALARSEDLEQLGLGPSEQSRLRKAVEDWQARVAQAPHPAQAGGGVCMMPMNGMTPVNGVRPGMPMQALVVNSPYGAAWIPGDLPAGAAGGCLGVPWPQNDLQPAAAVFLPPVPPFPVSAQQANDQVLHAPQPLRPGQMPLQMLGQAPPHCVTPPQGSHTVQSPPVAQTPPMRQPQQQQQQQQQLQLQQQQQQQLQQQQQQQQQQRFMAAMLPVGGMPAAMANGMCLPPGCGDRLSPSCNSTGSGVGNSESLFGESGRSTPCLQETPATPLKADDVGRKRRLKIINGRAGRPLDGQAGGGVGEAKKAGEEAPPASREQ